VKAPRADVLHPVVYLRRDTCDLGDSIGRERELRAIGLEGPRWLSDPNWVIPALNLLANSTT